VTACGQAPPPVVAAVGAVDAEAVAGTGSVRTTWESLGVPAPGTGRTFRALFGRTDPLFRRLDGPSRAVVLAAEAAGLRDLLPAAARDATAVVFETARGSLDTDLRFLHGLAEGMVHAALFPYTLPSTCLGEVAIRHGLRGATFCLSIEPGQAGAALREAASLIASGEAPYVLAGRFEVLGVARPGLEPAFRAVAVLVAAPAAGATPIAPWPWAADRGRAPTARAPEEDPFAQLARAARPHRLGA
jgi:hypothetical protein